jgi:hypothetical protein
MCPSNIGRELGRYLNAGADPGGGGGRTRRAPPLKLEKI